MGGGGGDDGDDDDDGGDGDDDLVGVGWYGSIGQLIQYQMEF